MFQTDHGENLHFGTQFFARWKIFNSCRNVENRTGRARPPLAEQSINSIRSYFPRHFGRPLRRAERDLSISFSTILKILRILIDMSQYKITRVQHIRSSDKVERVKFTEWDKVKT